MDLLLFCKNTLKKSMGLESLEMLQLWLCFVLMSAKADSAKAVCDCSVLCVFFAYFFLDLLLLQSKKKKKSENIIEKVANSSLG